MRNAFWIAIIVMGAVLARRAWAQDTAPIDPIATLEAGDFRALAVTADGTRLMIADAASNQVRVYDISDPSNPQSLVALDVQGTPVDLAAGDDFALVLVQTGGETDLIEVIAPADYDPRALYATVTYIDIPVGARHVRLSPDGDWGMVIGDSGYTLLEMISPNEVNSSAFIEVEGFKDGLPTNSRALVANSESSIQSAPLEAQFEAQSVQALTLVSPARLLAINERGTLGAALLEDGELVFFDPSEMSSISTQLVSDGDVLRFVALEAGEWLLVAEDGESSIRVLDVSDLDDIGEIGDQTLSIRARALTTWNNLLFVTDGQRIEIYPIG
jgi:hypothetical protein